MQKHAYSYLRVSSKSQIDGDGFPRQREAIRNFAERRQFAVVCEFREEGVSGTNEMADREALPALMERLRNNPEVKTVLIERADRLARDLMVSEIILKEFREAGVSVIAVDSDVDLSLGGEDDPTKKLMRQMFAMLAEWDKSVICKKLHAARQRIKLATGRCEGQKPYGKDDAERRNLEHMRLMRAQLLSFKSIAFQLNTQGIKPRSGAKWHTTAVRRILVRGD
jgi:DNA invertase Pin-like site-specific DNA recombinase